MAPGGRTALPFVTPLTVAETPRYGSFYAPPPHHREGGPRRSRRRRAIAATVLLGAVATAALLSNLLARADDLGGLQGVQPPSVADGEEPDFGQPDHDGEQVRDEL